MAATTTETKRKRRFRRRVILVVLFVTLGLGARALGFGLAMIGSESMSPLIDPGDHVVAAPLPSTIRSGAVVLVWWGGQKPPVLQRLRGFYRRFSESGGVDPAIPVTPVARLVVAVEGDRVTIRPGSVEVETANGRDYSVAVSEIAPDLNAAETRSLRVKEDQVFLLALAPGFLDSRHWGPVDESQIRSRLVVRVFPLRRFGGLSRAARYVAE